MPEAHEPDPTLEPFTIDPEKDPEKAVLAQFLNNVVAAANTVVAIAADENVDPRLRSKNAIYIIEYIMGKGAVAADGAGEGREDALARLQKMLGLMPDGEPGDGG